MVQEPLLAQSQQRQLQVLIEQNQRVARRLLMASGMVHMRAATEGDTLQFDGQSLTTVHGPSLRLRLIGGGQLSRCLASMAVMLDDLARMEALRTPAFDVGALGSLHNNVQRRKRLLDIDLSAADVQQLQGPVGLNIGALTPQETVCGLST